MWKVLSRARSEFSGDQRGQVAMLFAFSAIPLIGLLGGAADLTRYTRHKTQILNAMDSAAIALARRGAADDADADAFVNGYIASVRGGASPAAAAAAAAGKGGTQRQAAPNQGDPMLHLASFDATKIDGGYRVSAAGSMETAFLPIIGLNAMPLDLSTEVMTSNGNYEVALALDNTGSMDRFGRIEALRDAAGTLVDDLYKGEGTEDRVRMALVPFVTAVNVRTPDVYDEAAWIAPVGNSRIHGSANRLDLFKDMGVQFGGCVESRETDDETDTPPTSAATRWVPYLWPDEPDSGFGNSYLTDGASTKDWSLLGDAAKYAVKKGKKVSNTTKAGPNAACPRPIVELTNDRDRLHNEIDLMRPHNLVESGERNHSGTNVAQGLLWAWRALSPGAPYEQGVAYEDAKTTKVLVLLSDGRNEIVAEGNSVGSDYTSYGYLNAGRLGTKTDPRAAERAVDAKVKRVCESVKAKGIRVYTILFQVDFASTQDIFRDCASKSAEGEPLYYYVPEPSELEQAFRDIGEDLTSLHITR